MIWMLSLCTCWTDEDHRSIFSRSPSRDEQVLQDRSGLRRSSRCGFDCAHAFEIGCQVKENYRQLASNNSRWVHSSKFSMGCDAKDIISPIEMIEHHSFRRTNRPWITPGVQGLRLTASNLPRLRWKRETLEVLAMFACLNLLRAALTITAPLARLQAILRTDNMRQLDFHRPY